MKKLILSMMLAIIFLSFSNDKGLDRNDFNDLKLKAKVNYNKNERKKKIILTNDFDYNRLVFNDKDVDRHDFDELKLRTEATHKREELKRKRKEMLSNIFGS